MKKRMLAVLLTLCMALTLLPFGAAAANFQDVASGAYYSDAVAWAVNHDPQITNGTSETTFSPNSTCRRCEVVTFLWRAFGAEKMTGENPFADVKPTDYFYDAALWAAAKGITNGTDATHFSPKAPCTREQVAAFLWRAAESPARRCMVSPFADVLNKEAYSFDPILWAFENGVTNGKTANTFAPKDPCTRGQIVTFLHRALAKPLTPAQPESRLRFRPKVASQYLSEVFGEKMVEAWFNLVDAVMAGKTEFACPDVETFDWVIGQFPNKCFPVIYGLIDRPMDPDARCVNGVGHFRYTVPYAEVQAKIADFAALVEEILNETMKPDYSDFEKAVSLFVYFEDHYTYDYAAAEDVENGKADYVSAYRLLTGKTGVCHEIACAYSYLLMEAGVNASTMMGGNHEWSYLRLNGRNYHSDPTFALGDEGDLYYFLMTDEKRCEFDSFSKDSFVFCSNYTQDHPHRDYTANDETFRDVGNGVFDSLDHEKHTLHYRVFSETASRWETRTFDYKGY